MAERGLQEVYHKTHVILLLFDSSFKEITSTLLRDGFNLICQTFSTFAPPGVNLKSYGDNHS